MENKIKFCGSGYEESLAGGNYPLANNIDNTLVDDISFSETCARICDVTAGCFAYHFDLLNDKCYTIKSAVPTNVEKK